MAAAGRMGCQMGQRRPDEREGPFQKEPEDTAIVCRGDLEDPSVKVAFEQEPEAPQGTSHVAAQRGGGGGGGKGKGKEPAGRVCPGAQGGGGLTGSCSPEASWGTGCIHPTTFSKHHTFGK